jgi:hypothetical protein
MTRDIEDARTTLLRNRGCDLGYVEKWLGELDRALAGSYLASFRRLVAELQ